MSGSYDCIGPRAPISLSKAGALQSGNTVFKTALLVSPDCLFAWRLSRNAIDEQDILRFAGETGPARGDFLLLGTGSVLVFPSLAFRAEIGRLNLGLEAMDTSAACRTYNVLAGEGRRFMAALLPLQDQGAST